MRDRTKPKPDIDLEVEEPFKAKDVQVMETSYVDKTPLDFTNTCIFKGDFYDQDKKKVGMVLLPDTFFDLHQAEPNMNIFKQVGLDGYFGLEPWGVDIQRAYEHDHHQQGGSCHIVHARRRNGAGTNIRRLNQ